MSTVLFEQTSHTLTRTLHRWNRRLRLVRSALWVPRGLLAGLALGLGAALVSRLRPWLLPEQIAWGTGLATAAVVLAIAGWLWLRPQPAPRAARYFDRRFALKERTSTALELSSGTIPAPQAFLERQLADAVCSAQGVNAAQHLPIRLRWLELAAVAAMAALFVALLLTHNPQADQLRAQRALEQAIAQQAAALERQLEAIDENAALTPAERDALREPLEEALETLQQPDRSQQEAVAALSEAQQKLRALSEGMLDADRQAYREAAQALAGAEAASDLAQALNRPDLEAAAEAAEQLAQEMDGGMTAAEREALAERLDRAGEALAKSDPSVAGPLQDAGEALRDGDMQAAQDAMREAAESLRQQQKERDTSPLAEQARQAAQEARAGQRQIAQAGQESGAQQQARSDQPDMQSATTTQPNQPPRAGDPGPGEEAGDSSQPSGQPLGAQDASGEPSESAGQGDQSGQREPAGQGQPGDQGQAGEAPSQGDPQVSQAEAGNTASGESGALGAPGGEQKSADAAGAGESGQRAQAPGAEQSAAPAAGQGEGGAGVDTIQGQFGPQGEIPGNGRGEADSEPRAFDPQYAPFSIGGQSDTQLNAEGFITEQDSLPSREGELAENPAGTSRLAYQRVLGDYRGFVSDALESGRIPLAQRDIIHDYFASLEP